MMTSALQIAARRLHLTLLWGASLLVPSWKRSEWSQEWRTELWYVLRECFSATRLGPRSIRQATMFCMGAYQDAIWLRKRSWQSQRPFAQARGSAVACLLLLIAILFVAWGIAQMSPRVAAGMSRIQVYRWQPAHNRGTPCDCAFDLLADGRSLRITQLFFDGFSHYKITRETVSAEGMPRTEWTLAHAGSDFFALLQLPVHPVEPVRRGTQRLPHVVLSHETWMRDFGGKPNVGDTNLHVGSVDARVVGVAFGSSTGLPGKANAWLLGSDPQIGTDDEEFVVAHMSPVGYFNDGRWVLSVGGMFLGFLVIVITGPSIGEYSSDSQKPSLARRTQCGAFVIAKMTTLLGIAYFASVDLDCLFLQPFSKFSGYIQGGSSFALCFFGLSWTFRDQQRRCPICLRRMAHQVEVGQPSRTFLAWNGTELICERGHTLLHIPETPTSWFSSQRWVCLDGSWQFLFARSSETSTLL